MANIQDVARRAQVSTATVSRYFNSPNVLAPDMRERVRMAVQDIGYIPNPIARSLASARSDLVAALVPTLEHSIFNAMVEAMISELGRDGRTTMLGVTGMSDEHVAAQIESALRHRASAVILTGILHDEPLRGRLRESGATVIETWGLPDDPIDIAVGFSHLGVGAEVARFVMERGYSRPHFITARTSRTQARRDGFLNVWQAGRTWVPTETVFEVPSRFGQGRAAFRSIREMVPRPDVVICSSDWLAQGLIVEATAAGMALPDHLAVIGFGNMALAAEMRPTITTVEIDGVRIGREAAAVLRRRRLQQDIPSRHIDVGFKLIARDSA